MALVVTDDVGILVSTGGFTRDAIDEARSLTTRRVTLVDQDCLVRLRTERDGKLKKGARRRPPLVPVYSLPPEG